MKQTPKRGCDLGVTVERVAEGSGDRSDPGLLAKLLGRIDRIGWTVLQERGYFYGKDIEEGVCVA